MDNKDFSRLLKDPGLTTQDDAEILQSVISKFPYFQPAKALYLKLQKNYNALNYNRALKSTAAYTVDRSVLFDFITSEVFKQNEVSNYINELSADEKVNYINVSAEIVTKDSSFLKETTATKYKTAENISDLESTGRPLNFYKEEKHSFNEWLLKSRFTPIDRNTPAKEKETQSETIAKGPATQKFKKELKRKKKFQLIDDFIKKNPKLKPPRKDAPIVNIAQERSLETESLMTETLAKIYIEQGNYKKAIQSYKILSLKYPEKSGFFADQIKAIRKLDKTKENKK